MILLIRLLIISIILLKDDEKPYKTYMVSSLDFKSICLDKEKLHKYMSNIMKELVTVLTDSMDKYGEVDICLLRKKVMKL